MGYNYWCPSKIMKEEHPEGGYTLCDRKCEFCSSKGDLLFEEKDEYICPHTGELLKYMGERVTGSWGSKMTVDQIQKDRKKRSHEHFKKEIFPTLDKGAQERRVAKNPNLKKHM